MFGTEYNWLVSLTHSNDGIPRVRMAGSGLITVMVAVFCVLTVALLATAPRGTPRRANVAPSAHLTSSTAASRP